MAVNYSRTGSTLTVTITQDVGDLAASPASRRDKIVTALNRCLADLQNFIGGQDTAGLDSQIASLQAQKAALPAPLANF